MTTRFQSPLWTNPQPIAETRAERKERGWNQALRDAYMLDTSAGQLTMLAATSKAFDIPMSSVARPVVQGYSPFDDDLTGYERFYDEFESSTSPQETLLIKQMIDNNMDLRNNLEDYGGIRFATGLLDPINLIPVPFAIGRGFMNGAKTAVTRGAPIVGGTEMVRHLIDPTSTVTETAFATLGGTLFMGLMGGAVGKLPRNGVTVSEVLNKMIPPAGTTSMFAGVPWHLGTPKGLFKRVADSMRSTASSGEILSRTVDPDRVKVVDDLSSEGDSVKLVEIHVDDTNILQAAIRGGDTLQILSIEVPKHLRKQGIGGAAYKAAIKYAEDNGLRFVSDTEVSALAQRRYAGLKDEGFNVEENKNFTVDDEGTRFSTDSRPLYEIKRLVDDAAEQIPLEVRVALDDLKATAQRFKMELAVLDEAIVEAQAKLAKASKKGGWKTKRKNELEELVQLRKDREWQARRADAAFQDLNVKAAQMLDEATIKDWDLLPTGYNKLLGKLDQFPWWTLMKTPFRELAPELAVKYQMFALKMGATPGLNNVGNRVGSTTGPSVESLSIEYTGKWLVATRKAQTIYRKYAGYGESSSQVKQFTIDQAQRVRGTVNRALGGEKITTTADGKLTIQEFNKQISIAIAKGGRHSVPEVAEAASLYVKVLKEIGDEGKRLEVFATQRNINRRIEKLEQKIEQHNEKYGDPLSQSPGRRSMVDDLELQKMELEERARQFKEAENPEYVHRLWIADEVIAQEDYLKRLLTDHFNENPRFGKAEHPDIVAARVNEAYASILRDAETGGDLSYAPKDADKRNWLFARKKMLEEADHGLPPATVKKQLEIIERKLGRIANGEPITGGGGPLIGRKLDLDNANLIERGLIEGDVQQWMNHYVMRTAPIIETAKIFGDGRAQKHIDDLYNETLDLADATKDAAKANKIREEAERARVAMNDLRDIVHGVYQIPDDPSAVTPRLIRMLRNFNILGAMGRSVFMALGDIGNVVVSQGFRRSLGHAVEHFAAGISDGNIKMMRDEVDLAGSVSEVILGMRYHQMTDFAASTGGSGRLARMERGLANASQRFFLWNLLGPWTDMARRFSGGMLQSRLIEYSRLWKAGTLGKEEQQVMARLGINKEQAIQFVDEWEASGAPRHKSAFIANTEEWVSDQAKSVFRAAMNTEINRMVPTPGAVDKPKALLKSDWWKLMGQYRGFSIAATHRIMGAGLQTKGSSKYSGIASMVGIAMIVDAIKRPDYIQLPIEEQLLRAVELSAVTGIILDLNDTIERASAGSIGLRPMLGMDIRERNPNWANRMGTIGAVPNQWLTLMYGIGSDEAETDDLARAIRYMIPYNNLLWWNEAFTRAQRASVDFIEDNE
jgi:predicted GNAT family acetyltransferase